MIPLQPAADCACSAAPKLIFPCSGAADVGELADVTARTLTKNGVGRMFCLAGIGGRVSGIIKSTEAAAAVLAIDGCELNCARKTLEQAGFTTFQHICLADLGFRKGSSPVDAEAVAKVAEQAARML